jgi:uncharacterized protein (TIGR02118 family)
LTPVSRIVELATEGTGDRVVRDGLRLPVGVVPSDRPVRAIARDVDEGVRWFEVTSTVQLDGPPGALVMWVFFGGRRSLGRDEVIAHWRDVHAPLALRHHVGMSRYVQHVVVDGSDDRVDAIAELHFASADDLADRFYDSDDGRRAIAADVVSFAGRYAETFIVEREELQ